MSPHTKTQEYLNFSEKIQSTDQKVKMTGKLEFLGLNYKSAVKICPNKKLWILLKQKNETLSKERENIQEDKTEILNLVLNNK